MFDKRTHILRLQRAKAQHLPGDGFLIEAAVTDMMERLSTINRTFGDGIALFGRSRFLAETMADSQQIERVLRVEEEECLGAPDLVASPDNLKLEAESADLILAPFGLHWSADIPGSLIQLRHALRPDGLLLAILPGPDTLHELRTALLQAESEVTDGAATRVDLFTDIRDAGVLLQRAGFALPVVDQDLVTVRYNTVFDLIRDLRSFGATYHPATDKGEQVRRPALGRKVVLRLAEVYAERFSDPDGRIRASFGLVSLSGWKAHDSQQKPLKPGSAKTRLADALKVPENKL